MNTNHQLLQAALLAAVTTTQIGFHEKAKRQTTGKAAKRRARKQRQRQKGKQS